jgi:hypothetical protein
MTARYAIYYAPRPDSALWRRASAWLGRDAYDDQPRARPALPDLAGLDLDALTAEPRTYGFHATLKAPFALAPGRTEAALLAFAGDFARRRRPFQADIAPSKLGPFHAFQLAGESPAMAELHTACVREFEPFRAPPSDLDLARRRKGGLSEALDRQLTQWGYPYVFGDFRFHMTLSAAVGDEAVSGRLSAALADYFAGQTGAHLFDGVAVFRQPDRSRPFVILERFDFAG